MPGRLDTTLHPPPVRLSRALARTASSNLLGRDPTRLALGAGNYGQREVRFASVPIRLRINRSAGPNTAQARARTIPIGQTRRKRGYPPIVDIPTGA